MLVVHGAGCPCNKLQDRYLAKLMPHIWISCAVCYITFTIMFNFKDHIKSDAHLLAIGLAGVKDMFWGEFMMLLDRNSVGDETPSLQVL